MSAVLAVVAVPVLMLTASACSSSNGNDAAPTGSPTKPVFRANEVAQSNYFNPCYLASSQIESYRRKGLPKNTPVPAAQQVKPVELNGERRCEYDSGALVISTYVEKPGKSRLYQAVLATRKGSNSQHTIGGELAKHVAGVWFTYHGETTGSVFQPNKSGLTIVIQTTTTAGYDRGELYTIAKQATKDVEDGFGNDEEDMKDSERFGFAYWGYGLKD
jgi:hypothetical protein